MFHKSSSLVSSVFIGTNFHRFCKMYNFEWYVNEWKIDMSCPLQMSCFLLQYTFDFVDPFNSKSHDNLCLMTTDETKIVYHAHKHWSWRHKQELSNFLRLHSLYRYIHVYIDTGALGYNLTSSTVQLGYLYDLLFLSVMNCMKYFC